MYGRAGPHHSLNIITWWLIKRDGHQSYRITSTSNLQLRLVQTIYLRSHGLQ